jgi:hypothetical protein
MLLTRPMMGPGVASPKRLTFDPFGQDFDNIDAAAQEAKPQLNLSNQRAHRVSSQEALGFDQLGDTALRDDFLPAYTDKQDHQARAQAYQSAMMTRLNADSQPFVPPTSKAVPILAPSRSVISRSRGDATSASQSDDEVGSSGSTRVGMSAGSSVGLGDGKKVEDRWAAIV